jgi:hypothetical protein
MTRSPRLEEITMRDLFVATFLTLSLSAHAAPPAGGRSSPSGIRLDNLRISGAKATGQCGPATVEVTGLEARSGEPKQMHIASSGKVVVRAGSARLVIGADGQSGIFLQDENKLHCVDTAKGHSLVLASYCFGRSCAPVDYRVIDPKTAKVLGKPNAMDECGSACAQSALGRKLPAELVE